MDAIILSGLPAVGKTTVANLVAQKLGLNVVGGGEILKEIASEAGVKTTGDDWWDTPEGIRFLEERKRSEKFDKEVDQRLLKRVEEGDVVITSYTIPWLSKKGIKVWLSGSPDSRAERMAVRDRSDKEECKRVIAIRDEENHNIYQNLYGIDFGRDLTPFDIVVDTDGIPASNVAEEILRQLRKKN
jgi:CMP/dCMP kinase